MSGYIKGWCPSLEKPMESGDGLLVRLNIADGIIESGTAKAVAMLAACYGNGQMDFTSRGNLQIRGVSKERYAELFEKLSALGFNEETRKDRAEPLLPVLGWTGNTLALGLLFGRINVPGMLWLADKAMLQGDGLIRLSPYRIVYLHLLGQNDALLDSAQQQGFITDSNDNRRRIEACPGAPACSSAEGATRELALGLAGYLKPGKKLHVSGCAKGCACAAETSIVVTANNSAYDIAFGAGAGAAHYAGFSAEGVIELLSGDV